MPQIPPFTDIHCHLLPGIDDGASDWAVSLAMARMAVDDGFATIIATPHQLGRSAQNRGDTIRQLTVELGRRLQDHGIPLDVLPGGDVRIEPNLVRLLRSGDVLSLADRRRHVLLELPHDVFFPLDGLLGRLQAQGIVGILSHPERNLGILARPEVLGPLVDRGCLLQITAGSLVGSFGPEIQRFTHWMVGQGLVHFVSTDAHGVRRRRPLLRRAFDCVAELADWETAVDVCCRNPSAVAEGRPVTLPTRYPRRSGWAGLTDWFRRKRAG